MKYYYLLILFIIPFIAGMLSGCESSTENGVEEEMDLYAYSGWNAVAENWSEIPYHLSSRLSHQQSLPLRVDLTNYFPPVGRQFAYQTAVAWAVGFYYRTYLYALNNQFTPLQVTDPAKQFSPKDLMMAIDGQNKGGGCGPTTFKAALDVMKTRGIAQLSVVPYENLGNCSEAPDGAANSSASNFKIKNYWKIYSADNRTTIDERIFKEYLAQDIPVAVGVRVGKYFADYDTSATVLYSDNYSYDIYNNYHAMVVVGYDDTVGTNGAFKLINSFGVPWGHNGYIWVDYDFFFNGFCLGGLIIENLRSGWTDPDENKDNIVDNMKEVANAQELMATYLEDNAVPDSTDPHYRMLSYNAYNLGTLDISRGLDWNISYCAFNPDNPDDFRLLVYDYYSNDFGEYGERVDYDNGPAESRNIHTGIHIPGKSGIAGLFDSTANNRFDLIYKVPSSLSGEFYFVLIVDGNDKIDEPDEMNNFIFLTDANGGPISVTQGVILEEMSLPVKGGGGVLLSETMQRLKEALNRNVH